jgi:hypothetical protein
MITLLVISLLGLALLTACVRFSVDSRRHDRANW